jgi:hypothetical protein
MEINPRIWFILSCNSRNVWPRHLPIEIFRDPINGRIYYKII